MDPVCHTLFGATLARTGLKDRTTLATAALVLGANAPDVDAITYFVGESLYWRRGWTHGVLALGLWPFIITGVLLGWFALRHRARPTSTAPRAGPLLWVSTIGVISHPTLDFMNNYGVRWLMPFAGDWFYGDALFIVDPLVWSALALGVIVSWRARQDGFRARRAAQLAVAFVAIYAAIMLGLGQAARTIVVQQFAERNVHLARAPMVSPVLGGLSRRYVVADDGARYYVVGFRWWPSPRLDQDWRVIVHNAAHPAVQVARRNPEVRGFVGWARFPFYVVEERSDAWSVSMDDARYAPPGAQSWAAEQVTVRKELVDGSSQRGHTPLSAP